jgi:hypothetical protein
VSHLQSPEKFTAKFTPIINGVLKTFDPLTCAGGPLARARFAKYFSLTFELF